MATITFSRAAKAFAKALAGKAGIKKPEILWGTEGLKTIATMPEADMVLNSLMGMRGLEPTLAAIEAGKDIAFANKETLVVGGELVMEAVKRKGVKLLPVDSEHSAIFQSIQGAAGNEIKRIILTASGGPFRGYTREQLEEVTLEQALNHPNWSMGSKITIDSASMMNKGLEVIEAMRLYDLPLEQVDVVIHRQSIVHSFVECVDGAVMAQLGTPDMRLPIQLALTYPERKACPVDKLDLTKCGQLSFCKPDMDAFPCLALARHCAMLGGTACPVMNGANEAAVALFLEDRIGFYDIYELVRGAVEAVPFIPNPTLEQILEADKLARAYVLQHSVN